MHILHAAMAGTLESSDLMVEVLPSETGLQIEIQSPVLAQYGEAIRQTVLEVAAARELKQGCIRLDDHGALDCTIRARLNCALDRAATENKEALS